MLISSWLLTEHNACKSQVELFNQVFPKGIDSKTATLDDVLLAVDRGLNIQWFVYSIFPAPTWEDFYKATAPAWEDYHKAIALAREDYIRATAPDRKDFDKAVALAWEAYKKAIAPAFLTELKKL